MQFKTEGIEIIVPQFMKEIIAEITHEARRSPDISRARALLGDWQPRVTLEEGLAATTADFRARLMG